MQRVANQQQKHSSILKDSGAKLIFPRAEEREVTGRRDEGETRLQKIGRLHSGGISIRNEGVLISAISALQHLQTGVLKVMLQCVDVMLEKAADARPQRENRQTRAPMQKKKKGKNLKETTDLCIDH